MAAGTLSSTVAFTAGTVSAAQTAVLTASLNGSSKRIRFKLRPTLAQPSRVTPQPAGRGEVPRATPSIRDGGVVNTASYAAGGPPFGSLAQGSLFSIYGSDLGPEQYAGADRSPYPTTLGGVSIKLIQAAGQYDAGLLLASKGQINAILPAAMPLGDAQVVVTYNGTSSAPAAITVSKVSIGVFQQELDGQHVASAQNLRSATESLLNLSVSPAKPDDVVDLWVTGLGPAPDATPIAITVGGIPAQRVYPNRQPEETGVEHIFFTVPSGIAFGCRVPVVITSGGIEANPTVIAVTADGSSCK